MNIKYPISLLLILIAVLGSTHTQAQEWVCRGKTGCTTIGAVCPDGSVFAGCPPSSHTAIYVTRYDAGQAYTGSCTGTRSAPPYNNGNATGRTNVGGASSPTNGAANTAALVAADSDRGTGGTQPHQAAAYCDSLSENGKADWYLPASAEYMTIYAHRTAIGGISAGSAYWTSSQANNTNGATGGAHIQVLYDVKDLTKHVRCAWRD